MQSKESQKEQAELSEFNTLQNRREKATRLYRQFEPLIESLVNNWPVTLKVVVRNVTPTYWRIKFKEAIRHAIDEQPPTRVDLTALASIYDDIVCSPSDNLCFAGSKYREKVIVVEHRIKSARDRAAPKISHYNLPAPTEEELVAVLLLCNRSLFDRPFHLTDLSPDQCAYFDSEGHKSQFPNVSVVPNTKATNAYVII